MRTVALPLLLLIMVCSASAQTTTYTATQDGCGAKNLGYCVLHTLNDNGAPFTVTLDARYAASGQINTLEIDTVPYSVLTRVHGSYSGFTGNPNGTHASYYGVGEFGSDDGTIKGAYQYYAYYVPTCSGRGCAGTVVGWHFKVLAGSTVTVK
jgi:hypothetical protein